ncbi:MAG: hypothetical protein WCF67_15530 [Chitinophagaceae bacterium]
MKKHFFGVLAIILFTLNAGAQIIQSEKYPAPTWLSDKGYWVIESNVKTPRQSIVHFYNNEHVVVYREKVEGFKINLQRKKTLFRLKGVLEQAIVAWEREKVLRENERLVIKEFR